MVEYGLCRALITSNTIMLLVAHRNQKTGAMSHIWHNHCYSRPCFKGNYFMSKRIQCTIRQCNPGACVQRDDSLFR